MLPSKPLVPAFVVLLPFLLGGPRLATSTVLREQAVLGRSLLRSLVHTLRNLLLYRLIDESLLRSSWFAEGPRRARLRAGQADFHLLLLHEGAAASIRLQTWLLLPPSLQDRLDPAVFLQRNTARKR